MYLHLGHVEVRPVDVVEVADLPLLPSYLAVTNVDIQLVCSQGRILHKLCYIAHLEHLCIYHWLFVLIISVSASFQHRDGYSNVLVLTQVQPEIPAHGAHESSHRGEALLLQGELRVRYICKYVD